MSKLIIFFYILSTITGFKAQAQNASISGKITSGGQPIAYASVSVKGTTIGTTTNDAGIYVLKNIPAGNSLIVFSAVGYQKKQIGIILASGQNKVLDMVMEGANSGLNEVIVTGASRATELRKSPVAVAVITRKMMEQNVNTNLIDAIVKGVPGVSAVTTGPNISKPFIRGLGYNRVLTLYDGLRQEGQQWGDEHGIEIDQYGLSRAEVVKGPASLTYGSDALAGVINMIPYTPVPEKGQINGDYAIEHQTNNGLIGTSLGLGYRSSNWKYALRGTSRQAYSYSNKVDGVVYGTAFREYNLSASARLDKSWGFTKFAATLYDNRQEIPDGSRDSINRMFTRQVLDAGDNINNRPVVPLGSLKTYAIQPLHQRIQHYRFYNNSQLKIGEGSLDAQFGIQQSVRREYNHPTIPSQAGLYVVLNTFSYGIKYNMPTIAGIESTIGLGGMYQDNTSKEATDFPIPDYNLFDLGGYLFLKKSFDKLDISGGLRLDNRNINWNDFYVGTNPQTGFGQHVAAGVPNANLQFSSFAHTYSGLSGSVGLTYNFSERVLMKANIARGYRAPNITEVGSNGLDPGAHIVYLGNRSFRPEFNLQQDIGVMAYLKDVDLSLELFNNDIQNYIYQSRLTDANGDPVVIVPGNLTYQYQQSKARLYGSEITINLHPRAIKFLQFNNSLAYVVGLNKNEALLAKYGNAAKYLPFIPPLHIRTGVKVTAQQGLGIFQKAYFRVDADAYAAQNRFYALDNTETYAVGYTLTSAGIGATIKTPKQKAVCDISFQVDNLFDIAYQSNLNRLKYFEYYTASPSGRLGIYNVGRNVSLKLIVPIGVMK